MKNEKQVPLIDDYDIAAYTLANGNKGQREATLIDHGHHHDSALAMLVLHDELKRNPKQPHLYAIVLSKFLNRRNADFILNLVGDPNTHITYVVAKNRMRDRLVTLLIRSMDQYTIQQMQQKCDIEFLKESFQDNQYWKLYYYICTEIGCNDPEEPFKRYAESRNYLEAHTHMKGLFVKGTDDEILDHLINCRGQVLFSAIRHLQQLEHPGLLEALSRIEVEKGPLFGFPVVKETIWELEQSSLAPLSASATD